MTSRIDELRAQLRREFDPANIVPEDHIDDVSPCGQYVAEIDLWTATAGSTHPFGCRAVVRRVATSEVVATVLGNEQYAHRGWATRSGRDYFLFAEDYEGQSAVDLATGLIVGFSSPDETFIGVSFYVSQEGDRLAVDGCYWACPYEIVVYDFREPLRLPWPILARHEMLIAGAYSRFGAWLSPTAFTLVAPDGAEHVRECPAWPPAKRS